MNLIAIGRVSLLDVVRNMSFVWLKVGAIEMWSSFSTFIGYDKGGIKDEKKDRIRRERRLGCS